MMQIVEELKIYKESTGKKATDIAREMGIPTRTVQNWLNGDYNPTPKNSVAIFNYLSNTEGVEAEEDAAETTEDAFVLPDNYPPLETKEARTVALTLEASAEVAASAERTGWTYKQVASEMIMYAVRHRKYKGKETE